MKKKKRMNEAEMIEARLNGVIEEGKDGVVDAVMDEVIARVMEEMKYKVVDGVMDGWWMDSG